MQVEFVFKNGNGNEIFKHFTDIDLEPEDFGFKEKAPNRVTFKHDVMLVYGAPHAYKVRFIFGPPHIGEGRERVLGRLRKVSLWAIFPDGHESWVESVEWFMVKRDILNRVVNKFLEDEHAVQELVCIAKRDFWKEDK